jgi:hypothetical protein
VGHASRYSSLLHVEASQARISQSGFKAGGVIAGGAHDTITKVALESSQRWMDRCDGLHHTLLHFLYRFHSIRP